MLHARSDYDRIQDPAGKIAEDEPVFLLRAKDKLAPDTLRFWADGVEVTGNNELAEHIRAHADAMEKWQEKNGCKLPDAPKEAMK